MNEWIPTVFLAMLHIQSMEITGAGEDGEDLRGKVGL